MRYRSAVAEARQLVKRSETDQWRLAELSHGQVAGGASARQWALDIGVSHTHVNALVKMWDRFGGKDLSTRPKYSDAYIAVMQGTSVEDARPTQRLNEARAIMRKAPVARRAEIARELITDPDVADHMAADEDSVAAVQDVDRRARDRQDAGQRQVREGLRPIRQAFGGIRESVDPTMQAFAELADRMAEVVADDVEIDPEDWSMIRYHWKKITEELEVYAMRRDLPPVTVGAKK